MNTFKITLLIILSYVLAPSAQASLFVFTCEPEWAALTQELGKDLVKTYSATSGLQDPHQIQARPSLIAKVRRADLVVCTGADLEVGWLPLLLRRASNRKIQSGMPGYFIASDYVDVLGKPATVDRSQGDVHPTGNPHIQTNPKNILRIAKALSQRLAQLDAGNAEKYKNHLADFSKRWNDALQRWQEMTKPLKGLPIIVHHNSWLYMQDWLNLNAVATLENIPGIPPGSGHLASIINQMKTKPAKVIIYAAYQNGKAAHWLSEKTGIPVIALPFTIGGNEQATDLFALYDDTFQQLLKAVK